MVVSVNGERREIAGGSSVLDLLHGLGMNPKTVAVQCNDVIVDRKTYGAAILNDGDALELVRFVGGG